MSIWNRLWIALFGPWIGMRSEKTLFLVQRGYYGQLMISAQDDCYAIQLHLTGEQALQLAKWLQVTGNTINPSKRNNVIKFPQKDADK